MGKTLKIALCVAAGALLLGLGYWLWNRQGEKPAVVTNNVTNLPPVSESSDVVPDPSDEQGAILDVEFQPEPTLTNPDPKPLKARIYVPRDPRKQKPSASIDSSSSGKISLSWTPVREPFFDFETELRAGVDVDLGLAISPVAGVSLLQIGGKLHLGPAADFSGAGLFAGWEIADNLELDAMWRAISFEEGADAVAIGIMYEF